MLGKQEALGALEESLACNSLHRNKPYIMHLMFEMTSCPDVCRKRKGAFQCYLRERPERRHRGIRCRLSDLGKWPQDRSGLCLSEVSLTSPTPKQRPQRFISFISLLAQS